MSKLVQEKNAEYIRHSIMHINYET